MVNSNATYLITGRCKRGVAVDGYIIKNLMSGELSVISTEQTKLLAINKLIRNCTAQEYDGDIILKGINCKLKDLPNYNMDGTLIQEVKKEKEIIPKFLITNRIVNGKSTVGYTVQGIIDNRQFVRQLHRDDVIKLARDGKIANARVQQSQGGFLLRGVGCNILDLPSIKI